MLYPVFRFASLICIYFFIICIVTSANSYSDEDETINIELPQTPNADPEISSKPEEEPYVWFVTEADVINDTEITPIDFNKTRKVVSCKLILSNVTVEERSSQEVEMVNSTRLADLLISDNEITNKESEAQCTVVLFYSRLCAFSAMAAPHFNALARSFPDLKMVAIDALKYHSVNTQYGIVGVPTIILFHNGRPVAKYNGSQYTVHYFVGFIRSYSGIKEEVIAVHSQDFQGPVPSVIDKEIDYFLVLSWTFIIICTIYFFSKSFLWRLIIEMVKNSWREAEAQHAHVD